MKYVLIIWVFVVGMVLLLRLYSNRAVTTAPKESEVATITTNNNEEALVSNIPTENKYCFVRKDKGTEDAPYSLEENVVLNFNGSKVTGTKQGIQEGPDFINGYVGTLSGATITNELGDEMELVFDYEVDGSQNKELEVYVFDNDKLIKKRWVLHEAKINGENILVPDYVGEPTIYTYTKIECVE
jgi:hypothetical protein